MASCSQVEPGAGGTPASHPMCPKTVVTIVLHRHFNGGKAPSQNAEKVPKGEMGAELFRGSSSLNHQETCPPEFASVFSETVPTCPLGGLPSAFQKSKRLGNLHPLPLQIIPFKIRQLTSRTGNERDQERGRRLSGWRR